MLTVWGVKTGRAKGSAGVDKLQSAHPIPHRGWALTAKPGLRRSEGTVRGEKEGSARDGAQGAAPGNREGSGNA